MQKVRQSLSWVFPTLLGSFVYAAGFTLFLLPGSMNGGGVTGLSMVIHALTGAASVGTIALLINLPLFLLAGVRIGKVFFMGSLLGTVASNVMIDLLTVVPMPALEPLLACLYGGAVCGLGLGIVFASGTSTGGTDILGRLLKRHAPNVPMGVITAALDAVVVILTGVVFRDITKTLYSGITIFVSSQVMDVVIYRFDYSKVALIITEHHETVAEQIGKRLNRGATYLHGEGSFTGTPRKVILTVVKRRQLAELKALVMELDDHAFVIVQEAHQVLGDGFSRYSKDAL